MVLGVEVVWTWLVGPRGVESGDEVEKWCGEIVQEVDGGVVHDLDDVEVGVLCGVELGNEGIVLHPVEDGEEGEANDEGQVVIANEVQH